MKLSKQQIAGLSWPKGATHLRVITTDGKSAVASRKSAPTSLEGVDGEWRFGALVMDAKGKKEAFTPLAGDVVPAQQPQDAPAVEPGGTATQTEAVTGTVSVGGTKEARAALFELYAAGGYTKRAAAEKVSKDNGLDLILCWNCVHQVAGRAKKAGVVGSWVRAGRVGGSGAGSEKRALKAARKAIIKALLASDTSDGQSAKALLAEFRRVFAGCKAIVVRLDV